MPAAEPGFLQLFREDCAALRQELHAGLARSPATVSPKFFYDALGSRLFEAITELAEYYPTRTEAAIMQEHLPEIAAAVGPGSTLVDLGAGNCHKGALLFAALQPARYVAVDISVEFVRAALTRLQREYPHIAMTGVGLDFSQSLDLPPAVMPGRPVFFYAGSSIGNFAPDDAAAFLHNVCERAAEGGGLLIGVDLVKPAALLEAAYDDALGVTAAFNLNLLLHLNRLLGSNFAPVDWRHVARFDAVHSRIEMHLEARRDLTVRWLGGERRFSTGERMHTENSYKYTPDGFADLLRAAGFSRTRHWTDPRNWFAVHWAEP
jgi:L-histidine N-alpha-methyltransferase